MGAMGTRGIGGIVVDTVTTDAAGQLSKTTYPIPAALHGSYQVAIRLQTGHANPYFAYNWFFNSTAPGGPTGGIPGYAGFPTFRIVAVERDVNVAIGPNNFPPNQTFTVTMGAMGTRGIGGIVVDTVTTDAAGALSKVIFTIPDALKGSYQVAIRLSTAHANPYFAYNWFFNNTTGPGGGMGIPGYGGYPTFSITAVTRDADVTIGPNNFPPNQSFTVTMGAMGTRGIGGIVVDTVTTDAAGALSKTTFTTPAALYGSYQIAIRLQQVNGPYFAYNWFYNNTAPGSGHRRSPGRAHNSRPHRRPARDRRLRGHSDLQGMQRGPEPDGDDCADQLPGQPDLQRHNGAHVQARHRRNCRRHGDDGRQRRAVQRHLQYPRGAAELLPHRHPAANGTRQPVLCV
jgi:hypothetical protein